MAWVVDTSVLIDVFENDPQFGLRSAGCLKQNLRDGLLICPVTYVEFAPASNGDVSVQEDFLSNIGVDWEEPWTRQDTSKAHALWHRYVQRREDGKIGKRPIADILIGAFASRFQGLITRNRSDFVSLCPDLRVVAP